MSTIGLKLSFVNTPYTAPVSGETVRHVLGAVAGGPGWQRVRGPSQPGQRGQQQSRVRGGCGHQQGATGPWQGAHGQGCQQHPRPLQVKTGGLLPSIQLLPQLA